MESEKVKETLSKEQIIEILKKRIENINPWETYALEYHKGLLDLINELESENNKLKKYKCDWLNGEKMHLQAETEETEFELICANKLLKELRKENQKLKNRIAELENGIAKSMLGCEFLPECTNEKLKQFAERLKKRILITPHILGGEGAIIDETLKEFLSK